MKSALTANRTLLLAVLLFAAAVAAGVVFSDYKYRSLAYEVDFSFYMQFAAKLFDPHLTNRYSFNGRGYNFLGLTGKEGEHGFHQAIHMELIKYAYALLYRLSGSPIAIYLFFSLLYFSPLAYLALVHPKETLQERLMVLLFGLLYIAYPSTYEAVTFDLRPRVLLNPAIALALFSVHYRRPLWERAASLALLFLIREEGLLFGLVAVAYNYFRDGEDRRRSTGALLLTWLLGATAAAWYFLWSGYPYDPSRSLVVDVLTRPRLIALLVFVALAYLAVLWRFWLSPERRKPGVVQLVTSLFIYLPIGSQFYLLVQYWFPNQEAVEKLQSALDVLLYSPNVTILYTTFLTLLVLVWESLKGGKPRATANSLLLAFSAGMMLLTYRYAPDLIGKMGRPYDKVFKPEQAVGIFEFRDRTDKYRTSVLTDSHTYEAFYDYENVYVYERLPLYLAPDEERYHPDNVPYLASLLEDEVDFVAVGRGAAEENIRSILEANDIEAEVVSEEGSYVIFSLDGG